MSLPLPLFVGLRYLRARHRHRFISLISLVSVFGIALGLTAIITVMSVMNGFHDEIRDRILSMVSHINVTEAHGRVADWEVLSKQVNQHSEVLASAPFIEGQAMLMNGSRVSGTGLRGILPDYESQVSALSAHMVEGRLEDLQDGDYRIVLGAELAQNLGVQVGDRLTLVAPQASSTVAGLLPRLRRFEVAGVFRFHMYQYDRHLALLHLSDAGRVLQLGDQVSGVKLNTSDLFRAPWVADQLQAELGLSYRVRDWSDRHAGFFRAIQMEKTMLFLLLLLIVLVAAFNIVSALLMTVLEKRADIAVLRTMGMTRREVAQVFLLQGLVIGVVGAGLGVAGGIALSLNLEALVAVIEAAFEFKFFAPEVYYISQVPSKLLWMDVTVAGIAALGLSLLASFYPARRAARVLPAEALRYE